jgi:hypothetical protein
MNRAKICVFLACENMWAVLRLFPHFLTRSTLKDIKNLSRYLSTNLISLQTSEIF